MHILLLKYIHTISVPQILLMLGCKSHVISFIQSYIQITDHKA